ncbi:hypothetical protein C469_12263 [Halorubrum lipolyticum DSM 21995]|uniref:DUF7982 domain-containing protein n=1 Tax=Halorubrum lipolyticum DSM 21995 TaxID=1227482 RepID=M0NLN5_9EURY|nr:hypothetical protein C469_12263 [Halorubrum lipolyticum DSM 21995]
MSRRIVAGGRPHDWFGSRQPARLFGVLGLALVGGGLVISQFETLLFVWGGTALFVAFLLYFVMTGTTVSSSVATDIYTTMAQNVQQAGTTTDHEYVPDSGGVTLVAGGREFDPMGEQLLRTHDDLATAETVGTQLSVLVDVLVNDLELATRATATTDDERATVTVIGSRIGTTELFDHPVASVIGVGLAHGLGVPVTVETSREDGNLVVGVNFTTSE